MVREKILWVKSNGNCRNYNLIIHWLAMPLTWFSAHYTISYCFTSKWYNIYLQYYTKTLNDHGLERSCTSIFKEGTHECDLWISYDDQPNQNNVIKDNIKVLSLLYFSRFLFYLSMYVSGKYQISNKHFQFLLIL